MLGHINIWLGPSDHFWLLTRDHSVVRWAPKNSKKTINVETLRRKNGTDLVSKPIIWIWSCALTSFLLPHSSEHRSRKPLERSILGIRWKSQGCIYLCSANAMTWAPERTKDLEWNFQKPFRRESWFFTATRFPPQNGYANAFCSDPHWLLIHHQNPKAFCSKGGWSRFKQHFVVWGCVCKRFSWHNYPAECTQGLPGFIWGFHDRPHPPDAWVPQARLIPAAAPLTTTNVPWLPHCKDPRKVYYSLLQALGFYTEWLKFEPAG